MGQGFGNDFGSSMSDIFEDIFGDMMGGGRRSRGRERGADLRYNMEITLEEAFHGKTAEIEVPTSVTCKSLLGQRRQTRHFSQTPARPVAGWARSRATQGFFTVERTCPELSWPRGNHR